MCLLLFPFGSVCVVVVVCFFFFQAEDGIRDLVRSRGLGDVYKRQLVSDKFGMTYLFCEIAQYGQITWELHLAWGFKVIPVSYTHLTLPTIYSV